MWLEEIGGGWLGLTEEETDNCSMQWLIKAMNGRLRMLNWKSGDIGPRVTNVTNPLTSKRLFESLRELKKQEGGK